VFVVYGSLVPLDFKSLPLSDAWEHFKNIQYLQLGLGSRADWVANILLFIPLAFLWMAVLSANSSFYKRLVVSVCVSFLCILLCVSIEFTQLFFPARTVSINDIIAECIGTVIGVSAWWLFGNKLILILEGWLVETSSSKKVDNYLQVYLGGLFLYSVMPLDLTISVVEIYHKWNEGRVILIPFSHLREEVIENIYEWGSEIALWIPVPILWQRKYILKTPKQLLFRVFAALMAIEFFQLFVYSRVTDMTDIVLGLVGGAIGIWFLRSKLRVNNDIKMRRSSSVFFGIIVYLFLCFLVCLVFWYPFNFEINNYIFKEKIQGLFNIPFYAYYYGTEFRAITEVFHKILFFIPLGAGLAFITKELKFNSLLFWGSFSILMLSAILIEIGQGFLPGKIVSSTDIVLYIIGGVTGLKVAGYYFLSQTEALISQNNINLQELTGMHEVNNASFKTKTNILYQNKQLKWAVFFVLVVFVSGGLFLVGQASFVPYNIRELIAGDYAVIRCIGLTISFFWCLGFPLWFLLHMISSKMNVLLFFIYGVGIHSFFAWLFIRLSAPIESIYDIVGFPVLEVPAEFEIFFRFFTLFNVFSLALFGSVVAAFSIIGKDQKMVLYFILGFIMTVVSLPICYWVIVTQAATDNLIELFMDEGLSFSIIGIFLYMWLFSFSGTMLSAYLVFHQIRLFLWTICISLISFPLGYMFLDWAMEPVIFKYGQVFSALQFLLSPDRSHYLNPDQLFISFCWLNFILIILVCVAQIPFWLDKKLKKQML